MYAALWRRSLSALDLQKIAVELRTSYAACQSCKTLTEAHGLARDLCTRADTPRGSLQEIMGFLNVPAECRSWVHDCWNKAGRPEVTEYAAYAAHVVSVNLFFAVALGAGLISHEKASNGVDIAYLYYLPFCQVFVSSDKLHRRCAEVFLRPDQEFVWGLDLKRDLSQLDEHYSKLPAATRERGVMSFASSPPTEGQYLVSDLWDRHMRGWRSPDQRGPSSKLPPAPELADKLRRLREAPPTGTVQSDFDSTDVDMVVREFMVRRQKGSWYQVPKDMK